MNSFNDSNASSFDKRKPSTSGSFKPNNFDFGGRSYVIASTLKDRSSGSPTVHSTYQIDEQTVNSANIGVTDSPDDMTDQFPSQGSLPIDEDDLDIDNDYHDYDYNSTSPAIEIHNQFNDDVLVPADETDPLLNPDHKYPPQNRQFHDYEIGQTSPQNRWYRSISYDMLMKPINFIPAVFLGTLLNILDGLSYGMIMFPLSESVFSKLGPSGLSMFYMSCIVSQLVYSLGGSAFKSGIGSEMIEVTPFFHSMALSILAEMGESNKDAVIATTIVTYAVSAIVTGSIFYLLGKLRLGSLVGFFPRHILVGCIGGVGYFLVITGIEVSSRLDGGVMYNLATFKFLFGDSITFFKWFMPLVLTVILILIQHRFHNSLIVPLFFIMVFLVFHLIVAVVPSFSLASARDLGFIFPMVEDNEPWYGFYELYKFELVDWWCIARQLPTMLALTFFGILHVPINVPALAVTVGMDQFDVDRELVAHGYSNALSGLVGSIQNYLVYTNSVLFIRAGADDRMAGVLLAIATGVVMIIGPVVIGFIPICVVGSLIYLLGYELLKEALYDTYGKLTKIEYSTIIIIVVIMGAWDFVYGVLAGILLACLSFVVEAATTPVVQGIYTGVVARSTVLRHPKQQEFLKAVGNQICVVKLQGTLFFGSIGGVESSIRSRFDVDNFKQDPVKFLILDMKGIVSIDFSAAEGFRRILNLCNEFDTQFIISSVEDNDDTVKSLKDVGLWDIDSKLNIQLFNTLNYALEWCESSFLSTYKSVVKQQKLPGNGYDSLGMTRNKSIVKPSLKQYDVGFGTTPRTNQVFQAATKTAKSESESTYHSNNDFQSRKQPLPLIMLTFRSLSSKDERFWSNISKYFVKEQIPENFSFYDTSINQPAFFIVETGLIKSVIRLESDQRELVSSILPMTAFGDLFEDKYRHISYSTVSDTVVWKLTTSKIKELVEKEGFETYNELLVIHSKLLRERFDTMTANLVLS
ncbi:uncharacterized vacuolar membrane protein [[Candida] jaroonii]|uniref:Uncharacterized vacuolar membrane protein n=1 Tax=[Candida] jaroonii TaxID=467808 RepID=A0ACA9Y6Q7_9ASCO|nr:uncharacterized vacuolar membrane protein [[Candida] jaroonii]